MHFTHPATEQTEALTDYRYIGPNPNNWIRFNDEDWRIIGVFTVETESKGKQQLLKIIRNEPIGGIAWDDYTDGNPANEWSTASLKSLLNGEYYNTEGSISYTSKDGHSSSGPVLTTITIPKGLNVTAQSQIESVKWYLGGISAFSELGGPDFYAFERGTSVYSGHTTNIIQKVGLMYPSDYMYTYANGVNDTCFTNVRNCYTSAPSAGWLFNSSSLQWTQNPVAERNGTVFYVSMQGYVSTTVYTGPMTQLLPIVLVLQYISPQISK